MRREPAQKKAQSVLELLTTYGWALVVIMVVLIALYSLGILNTNNLGPKAAPGSCQVYKQPGYPASLGGQCSGTVPQFVGVFTGGSVASYVTLSNTVTTSLSSFTATVWFLTTNGIGWNATVAFKDGSNHGWEARVCIPTSGGGVEARIDTSALVNQGTACGSVNTLNGRWHFEALTYSYATGNAISYRDGMPTGSPTAISGTIPTLTSVGGIGYGTIDHNFGGELANVQIYNTTLSASDIQNLYLEGIGGAPINLNYLVGWWPLNGNANDYSGNGHNGVSTNVAYTSNWTSGYTVP